MLLVLLSLLVSGCTTTVVRNVEPKTLPETLEQPVLEKLLGVIQPAFPPARTTFVFEPNGVMGTRLQKALRDSGYALSTVPIRNGQDLTYTIDFIEPERLLVGIKVGKLWRADQLFKVRDERELLPLSAATVSSPPPYVGASRRQRNNPIAGNASPPTKCETISIVEGSLKANVSVLLRRCGLLLGNWNTAPAGFIDDWLVQQPLNVVVTGGVDGVLQLLANTYQIEGSRRPYSTRVDFTVVQDDL